MPASFKNFSHCSRDNAILGRTFSDSGDFVKDATDDFVTDDYEGLDILERLLSYKS